jgi:sortase A
MIGPTLYQESLRQEYASSPIEVDLGAHAAPKRALPKDAVARLVCPRLEQELYVLPDKGSNLRKAPVWLTETPSPGTLGNIIFAGHRDTHFRFLKDIRLGDTFEVDSRRGDFTYKVTRISIVNPQNRKLLAPQHSGVLTLVTCYPFYYVGTAPKRFIVRAELVQQEKNNE